MARLGGHVLFLLAVLEGGWASCEVVVQPYITPGSCAASRITTCCSGDSCGAADGCQCDALCYRYGDCCSDILVTCPLYLAPANVTILNVTSGSVRIFWAMQFTTPNEQFRATYISASSLILPNSSHELDVVPAVDGCAYTAVLAGLLPSTTYTVQITAVRGSGSSGSQWINFTTTTDGMTKNDNSAAAVIQLRAGSFVSCEEWKEHVRSDIKALFRTSLIQVLTNSCRCHYDTAGVHQETLECSPSTHGQVYGVYRATVSGMSPALLEGLQDWLDTSPSVRSGITSITFDPACPLIVHSYVDPTYRDHWPELNATSEPVINASSIPAAANNTVGFIMAPSLIQETTCVTVNILIGAMVAELLVLVSVMMLVVVVVLCLIRNRGCGKTSAFTCGLAVHQQTTTTNIYHLPQINTIPNES